MKPRKITERHLIREAIQSARKWLVNREKTGYPPVVAQFKRVAAIDPETTTAAEIDATGQDWRTTCHGCRKLVTEAVDVGEEMDHESHTATLCHACLLEAVSLIQS